jgi:hypothetical protein
VSGASSRRRGRTFQSAVRDWWSEQGFVVIEPGGAGMEATDVVLIDAKVSVEAKNCKQMDLAGWVDQAVRQAIPGTTAIVHHKRRGRSDVGECYVTLRAVDLAKLIGDAR